MPWPWRARSTESPRAGDSGVVHEPGPKIVLGLPLFGDHDHVRPAVESLLAQTHPQVFLVVCDDGRGPREALGDLLEHPRVAYRRNEHRLGLIGNWRRVFELARRLHPDAPYFAWASDHDLWEPGWAESLAGALERSPEAALAYPRVARIDGGPRPPGGAAAASAGPADPLQRLRASYDRLAAGDMVYGLFRVTALERCGAFPRVIAPDRLLLAELSLQGTFVQVPEPLWRRRKDVRFSLARQRASLFGARAPRLAALPWWLQHAAVFTRDVALRDRAGLGRGRGLALSMAHASLAVRRAARRFLGRAWTRTRVRSGALAGRWLRRIRDQ